MLRHFLLLFICFPGIIYTQDIVIGIGGDFLTLSQAQDSISAGDSVMILNGVYSDGTQFLYDLTGREDDPITIYAEDRHQVIFRGGTESIHLVNAVHVVVDGLVIEGQTGNGMNIDDGGDYSTPTHHITIQNCIFREMPASGNRDFLKLSGLDSFLVRNCVFVNGGDGGSGIDMVGCHWGIIEDNEMDNAGVTGIQAKGGTQHITIRRNVFEGHSQRALNLGGSTGLQFFRPPLPDPITNATEASDLDVYANVFISNWAPIAYVGCQRVRVFNNTIYHPRNWVIRILQETTVPGFLPCAHNEFRNNIVVVPSDLREVNIGPNTLPETFRFSNNLWFNESSTSWQPQLPVIDSMQLIMDPLLVDVSGGNYNIPVMSPAVGRGRFMAPNLLDHEGQLYLDPPSIGAYEGGEKTTATDFNELTAVHLYPNPAQDQLIIRAEQPLGEISIYSLTGHFIFSQKIKDVIGVIDISQLATGVYNFRFANRSFTFIKQ